MCFDIMTAMDQSDDAGTVQIISRAETMWRDDPRRQAMAKRMSFASGDFFKPGAHTQSIQSGFLALELSIKGQNIAQTRASSAQCIVV